MLHLGYCALQHVPLMHGTYIVASHYVTFLSGSFWYANPVQLLAFASINNNTPCAMAQLFKGIRIKNDGSYQNFLTLLLLLQISRYLCLVMIDFCDRLNCGQSDKGGYRFEQMSKKWQTVKMVVLDKVVGIRI